VNLTLFIFLKNDMWHPVCDGNSDLLYVIYKLGKQGVIYIFEVDLLKRVEIWGAKVKFKLGLCSIEVRGTVYIHNLSFNHFFNLIQ